MLKSVLLYLESPEQAARVIEFSVPMAARAEARVRGMTLVDTRGLELAQNCESAAYLTSAYARHEVTECIHEGARTELTRACLKARLNFDVRRISGNPLEVLPAEARFHDLVVAALDKTDSRLPATATNATLSLADMLGLLQRGVQPLVVLPRKARPIERVLLVYDGSEASGRAVRSYFNLGALPAEHRLLAIGRNEAAARASLAEMAEYCAGHCEWLETGFAVGRTRRVISNYSAKWEADMLVLGVGRGRGWVQRLVGRASLDLVESLNCALFVRM